MKKLYLPLAISLMVCSCGEKKTYDATGIFETTTVTVSAETAGRLSNMEYTEGDTVDLGNLLACVDSSSFVLQRKQIAQQRRAVESSTPNISAQAAALRENLRHAEAEGRRVDNLFAQNAATAKQRDDAHAQIAMLKGQLEALLSSLGKARGSASDNASALQYQMEQIEEQIAKCSVKAPLKGTVLNKFAQNGEFASPGKPLYKIGDLSNMYMRAYFTVSQLADIKLGQEVTVIADFGEGKTFEYPGKIVWIAEESEFTPKSIQTPDSRANLVYATKIAVKNDGRLKLGQYGEVRLK